MRRGIKRITDNAVLLSISCKDWGPIVESNLLLVDTALPTLLTQLIAWLKEEDRGHASMIEAAAFLAHGNPAMIPEDIRLSFYENVMSRWLGYVAMNKGIDLPWSDPTALFYYLEIQQGDTYLPVWAIQATHSSLLLPRCSLHLTRHTFTIVYHAS